MKKFTKRQGFTLVELLIVVVVIGILSAMMMLSSTEAVSSARAADIISDLKNMKTAALEWYADNIEYVQGKIKKNNANFSKLSDSANVNEIIKYLGGDGLKENYSFSDSTEEQAWFACCKITDAKVFEKIKSRAKSVGLVRMTINNNQSPAYADDLATTTVKTGTVGLFIRY